MAINSALRFEHLQAAKAWQTGLETEPGKHRDEPLKPVKVRDALERIYFHLHRAGEKDEAYLNGWVVEGSKERLQAAAKRQLDLGVAFIQARGLALSADDQSAARDVQAYVDSKGYIYPTRSRLFDECIAELPSHNPYSHRSRANREREKQAFVF